jgi:hypothetical protein
MHAQGVVAEEFKATELEVGVVRGGPDGGAFRVLSHEEVDAFLVAISERD